jgi:hypothetical protein
MTTTTTTTYDNPALLWFHDSTSEADHDDCNCPNCRMKELQQKWAKEEQRAQQHKWGVCMDCGVGLDDDNGFFVDRRETQCDCFTCDKCFKKFFGEEAFLEAVSWYTNGKPIPQYTRFYSSGDASLHE